MTLNLVPAITDEQINKMGGFEAFQYGEELMDSRHPRHAARVLQRAVDAPPRAKNRVDLVDQSVS